MFTKKSIPASVPIRLRIVGALLFAASFALFVAATKNAPTPNVARKPAAPKGVTVPTASPASGTLSPGNPSIIYTDGPLVTNPSHLALGEPDCTAPMSCSDFTLTVSAASVAATKDVVIAAEWDIGAMDFDMFIKNAAGNLVATNLSTADPTAVLLPIPADGTVYHIIIVNSVGTGETFTGTITLRDKATPVNQGPGAPPRYMNYPAGPTKATDAGEPSLGVDWNPKVSTLKNTTPPTKLNTGGVAMYTAGPGQWRVNFDDCSSPAVNLWEDTNSPVITGLDPIGFVDHYSNAQLGTSYPPPLTPGRVFGMELGAGDSTAAFSDDDGTTWTPIVAGGLPAGADHETFGGGPFHSPIPTPPSPTYPNALYYCSQNVAPEAECSRSDDGGVTYGPGVPIFNPQQCTGGIHGHVKVSPQGTVYVPNSACGLPNGGNPGTNGVAISKDNGLTWNSSTVPGSNGSQDPSVGIGQNNVGKPPGQIPNTVYLGWVDIDNHAHIAHSPDEGTTWQDNIDVSAILGVQSAAFPVVVAGDDNRAAFGFIGTKTPGPGAYSDPNFPGVWHLYIAHTYDGGHTWILIDATPDDPIQHGEVCLLGFSCNSAQRGLLDFNDFTVDAEGRGLLGYADGCRNCTNVFAGQSTLSDGTVARQSGGRRLFSAFDPIEPAPPAAPQVLSAVRQSPTSVLVSWLIPDNGGSPITGYKIYRSSTSGTESLLATVSGVNTTKYLDQVAPSTSNWFYRVTAFNDFNGDNTPDESQFCREVNVNGVQPGGSACTAPYLTVDGAGSAGDIPAQPPQPVQGELTIERVSIGEPFTNCNDKSVTFVMKVQTLDPSNTGTAAPPPNGEWQVLFQVPDTNGVMRTIFVEANTQNEPFPTAATVNYDYGYRDTSPTGGGLDSAQCGVPIPMISSCPMSGSVAPDGTITMKLNVAGTLTFFDLSGNHVFDVVIPVGTTFGSIQGNTYLLAGSSPAGVGGGLIEQVSTTPATGSYTTIGNTACVAAAPVAILTASPISGKAPLTVNFNAAGSNESNPCANIVSYTMDFGDGTPPVTQASALFSHTYITNGEFPARLTVKDSSNQLSTNQAQVVIDVDVPITNIKSAKAHGAAGTFYVDLPMEGVAGVECRSGGTNNDYSIIYTFDRNLTSVGSTSVAEGTATINSNSGIGPAANQYTLNVTGVPNRQHLRVRLDHVHDTAGVDLVNVLARIDILLGDVNGVAGVTGSDVNTTKAQVGIDLSTNNFRSDVNTTGFISGSDVNIIKAQVGTSLP